MKKNFKRIAAFAVAAVMAVGIVAPAVAYADDENVSTVSSGATFTNVYTPDAAEVDLGNVIEDEDPDTGETITGVDYDDDGTIDLDSAFTYEEATPGGAERDTGNTYTFTLTQYTSSDYDTAMDEGTTFTGDTETGIIPVEIELTQVGTYYYTLTQDEVDYDGVTIDSDVKYITIVVENVDDALVATVTVSDDTTFNITIAATSGTAEITMTKTLTDTSNSGRTLEAEEFAFTVTDADGNETTVYNDADGNIVYSYDFDETGDYTFTVSEVAGDDAHITYDDTVWTFTLTVSEDEDGNLVGTISNVSEVE